MSVSCNICWLVFIAASLAGVGLAAWRHLMRMRTLRAMHDVEPCRIADAPEGALVRITGRLHAGPRLLEGPLSGRPCASYRVHVETVSRCMVDESEHVDFVVDDGSGHALVDVSVVEMVLALDHEASSGVSGPATPEQEAYLRRHGHTSAGPLDLPCAIRYREAALEPGETVVVVGRARWEDEPELETEEPSDGGYRESARRKRLVIEAADGEPVRVSDEPSARR